MLKEIEHYSRIGYGLMHNPMGMMIAVLPALLITKLIHLQIADIGLWILIIPTVLLFPLAKYMIMPMWGIYYISRIKNDYGVKTADFVKKFFINETETDLDIEKYARSVSEFPHNN